MNKCKNQDFRNWELNLGIGILNNYLKMEVLKIKFENLNFEKFWKLNLRKQNLKNYLRMEFKNK